MQLNNFRDWQIKFLLTAFALGTVLCSVGCQRHAAGKLLGKWEGRPDTAAARAGRESLKYGDSGSAPGAVSSENVTDWERYDLSVVLDFVDQERVEMSISGGSDSGGVDSGRWGPRSGKWHVLTTTPIGCTIEVETESAGSESEPTAAAVRRQFQLDLDEREGKCVGFTLMEVGADRELGTLYFRRPEE